MESTLSVGRSLFPWGYRFQYQLSHSVKDYQIPLLADKLLSILPIEVVDGHGVVKDLKGRDPIELLDTGTLESLRPIGEEIVFFSGIIGASSQPDNFSFSVGTNFDQFIGENHISHRITLHRSTSVPEFLTLKSIPAVVPLKLSRFRFALEWFSSRVLGSMLGLAPVVSESLLIDCSISDGIKISVSAEGQKVKGVIPERLKASILKVDLALAAVLGLFVIKDIEAKNK